MNRFLNSVLLTTCLWLAAMPVLAQDSDYYKQRRDKLYSMLKPREAAIIPGAWEEELDSFRQHNNFFYFIGIEQPNLLLLVSPDARSKEVLFLPARNMEDGSMSEAWTGEKLGPGAKTEKLTGIAKAAELGTFHSSLAGLAGSLERLYFDFIPADAQGPKSGAEVLLETIRNRFPHLQIVPLGRLTDSLRAVKDSQEIEKLQKAVDITGESLKEAISELKPGMHEYEIEARIEYGFHRRGSQRPGFPSIVGAGPNSVTLHYNENRRRIEAGEMVVMDVGAELDYYTADITRTAPSSGTFTERQKQVYQVVLDAQKAAIEAVKPGAAMSDVHAAARKVIDDAGFGEYFIHYTSHHLGMDVHDVGGNRDEPLQAGMVITVEPGIYIAAENLGIRIEDDVLVTRDGHRVLSADIPRTVAEIEGLMKH